MQTCKNKPPSCSNGWPCYDDVSITRQDMKENEIKKIHLAPGMPTHGLISHFIFFIFLLSLSTSIMSWMLDGLNVSERLFLTSVPLQGFSQYSSGLPALKLCSSPRCDGQLEILFYFETVIVSHFPI